MYYNASPACFVTERQLTVPSMLVVLPSKDTDMCLGIVAAVTMRHVLEAYRTLHFIFPGTNPQTQTLLIGLVVTSNQPDVHLRQRSRPNQSLTFFPSATLSEPVHSA